MRARRSVIVFYLPVYALNDHAYAMLIREWIMRSSILFQIFCANCGTFYERRKRICSV